MKPEKIHKVKLYYVRGQRTWLPMFDNSWELAEDLKVTLSTGKTITVPKGFVTDISSTPEFLWSLLKPFGDFIVAPIVHDWMYRTKYREEDLGTYGSRLFADKEMLRISKRTNSEKWHNRLDNKIRYYLVRIFGSISYNKKES